MTNFIDKIYEKVDLLLSDAQPQTQKYKLKRINRQNIRSSHTNIQNAWAEVDNLTKRRSPSPPGNSRCKNCNGHIEIDQTDGVYVCSECGIVSNDPFILDFDETKFHDYESDHEHAMSSSKESVRHGIISTHVSKEESFNLSLSRDLIHKYPWMSGSVVKQICATLNKLAQRSDQIFRTQKRAGLISVAYWIAMIFENEYMSPERVCRIFDCQMGQFKKCLAVVRKYDSSINEYLTTNMNDIYIKMYVYDKLNENKILPIKYADGILRMFYSIKTDLKISKQTLAYICCYLYMNQKSIILKNINPNIISLSKKIKTV